MNGNSTTIANTIHRRIVEDGGLTLSVTPEAFDSVILETVTFYKGYQVSIADQYKRPFGHKLSPIELQDLIKATVEQAKLLNKPTYIGIWREDDIVYYDTSIHVTDPWEARDIALKHNQKAIHDWRTGKDIYVNKWSLGV